MNKQTVTYTIEFNPETGAVRPWEVWVTSETLGRKFCSSSTTIKGAEKSRNGYAAPRKAVFNVVTPAYTEKQ